MKLIDKKYMDKYNNEDYVWYACYGSNINYKRFMHYIDGDITGKYSATNGCIDKSEPTEERPYIFDCPIYFAGIVKGGMVEDLLFLIMNILAKVMGKYIN